MDQSTTQDLDIPAALATLRAVLVTPAQAARDCKATLPTVLAAARAGRITAYDGFTGPLLDKASVESWDKTRKVGRPRKAADNR